MSTFGDLKVSTINGGAIGAKNAIINGNFGINQRGVSGTVTLSAGAYGHDRWKAGASGCTYTFATSGNVTTLTISAGSLIQVIEGINLESGTYTLSWTGTAQGKIGAGSYGDSGITGTAVGGTNLNIEFGTGTVSLVQFESGTVATPFERRQYGQELALCQRYCYGQNNSAGQAYYWFGMTGGTGTTSAAGMIQFPVTMRSKPAVTVSAANTFFLDPGITNFTNVVLDQAGVNGGAVRFTGGSGMTTGYGGRLLSDNTDAAFIIWSAEL